MALLLLDFIHKQKPSPFREVSQPNNFTNTRDTGYQIFKENLM